MNKKIGVFALISVSLLSGCSHKVDGGEGGLSLFGNLDSDAGIYIDGEKNIHARRFVLAGSVSGPLLSMNGEGGGSNAFDPLAPTPYTAPKPSKCGDMPCPDPKDPKPPSPTPTPKCYTPDCKKDALHNKKNQLTNPGRNELKRSP